MYQEARQSPASVSWQEFADEAREVTLNEG
jgi:hypothetical protein